jgi:hypothetical protein
MKHVLLKIVSKLICNVLSLELIYVTDLKGVLL